MLTSLPATSWGARRSQNARCASGLDDRGCLEPTSGWAEVRCLAYSFFVISPNLLSPNTASPMHHIRPATPADAPAIITLLTQLGYPGTADFLPQKLLKMLEHPDEILLVAEIENQVVAFISFHIIPQIALAGDFARISYFAVDAHARSLGIGKAIEEHCTALARQRHCDRIEVHCHSRRTDAHRFYFRQGYEESPKYLIKKLRD